MAEPLIRMQNIRKSYGRVQALEDANFHVNEREIVGLLGDNGAGKSTLIKVLSGAVPLTSGDIFIRGKKVTLRSTSDAIAQGIETIYQDSALVTQLSIARNLFLGREPVRLSFLGVLAPLDFAELRNSASALLKRVGISKKLDADAPVNTLSGGERQSIAISRAMQFAAKVIILDEPTNNLGVEETHGVLRFVREVRAAGHSVLFITHNIHHVFEVADRIVVMRRGEIVAERTVADTDLLTVESLIMGADMSKLLKDKQVH